MIRKTGILSLLMALNTNLAVASEILAQCENENISFTLVKQNRGDFAGFLSDSNNPNQDAIEFECERSEFIGRGIHNKRIDCEHRSNNLIASVSLSPTSGIVELNSSRRIQLRCESARVSRTSYQAQRSRCYKYNGRLYCPR